LPFVQAVRALFPGALVVAMGNTASRALTLLEVEHHKVRHPAQGGARRFAEGLRALVAQIS
jgi:hypothetical protein